MIKPSKVGLVAMALVLLIITGCASTSAVNGGNPVGGTKCNCEKMKHLKKQNSFLYRK